MRPTQWIAYICVCSGVLSCATPARNPAELAEPTPLPMAPLLTQVPHPVSHDLSDLSFLLRDKTAPIDPHFGEYCDQSFQKLAMQAMSSDEVDRGVLELMRYDPVHYHWCFYAKLLGIEKELQKESNDIEQRQRSVLTSFHFLAQLADGFIILFHDSRYMRVVVQHYRKTSAWVFARPLDLTPQGTRLLVEPVQPFGIGRRAEGGFSILEKYHLLDGH